MKDMRRCLLMLSLILSACTTDADEGLPSDPCALVTVEDVEAATGDAVVRSGLIPDERLMIPEGPNPCEYVIPGEHASIDVHVYPNNLAGFVRQRDGDPTNLTPVEGIGDEAFVWGGASLWVRVGGGYFLISSQHGGGSSGVQDLEELARSALD